MKITQKIIDHIIDRMFDEFSYCGHCGSYKCGDRGYRRLPDYLDTEKLLIVIKESLGEAVK